MQSVQIGLEHKDLIIMGYVSTKKFRALGNDLFFFLFCRILIRADIGQTEKIISRQFRTFAFYKAQHMLSIHVTKVRKPDCYI